MKKTKSPGRNTFLSGWGYNKPVHHQLLPFPEIHELCLCVTEWGRGQTPGNSTWWSFCGRYRKVFLWSQYGHDEEHHILPFKTKTKLTRIFQALNSFWLNVCRHSSVLRSQSLSASESLNHICGTFLQLTYSFIVLLLQNSKLLRKQYSTASRVIYLIND